MSESKALVVHPEHGYLESATDDEMAPDPASFRKLRALPRAFLRALIMSDTLTLAEAAERVGCQVASHKWWMHNNEPGYREAYEDAQWCIEQILERRFAEKAQQGLTQRYFDGKGKLKMVVQKEDATLIKTRIAAQIPERYGNRDQGTTAVQVNVVFKDE